jgi:hypothetical protein
MRSRINSFFTIRKAINPNHIQFGFVVHVKQVGTVSVYTNMTVGTVSVYTNITVGTVSVYTNMTDSTRISKYKFITDHMCPVPFK